MARTHSLIITGVSGYIGGNVLVSLLQSSEEWARQLQISVLVRNKEQVKVFEELGVAPILFSGFDSVDELEGIAEDFDSARALLSTGWISTSRARRAPKKKIGQKAFYLHQSGVSNLSDHPSANHIETRTFSDKEDIFSYEKYRESIEAYPQRTTDVTVVETGRAHNVPTCILVSPIIFGIGTGPFNKYSMGLPSVIDSALRAGFVSLVGDGSSTMPHVHIQDLADLILVFLRHTLEGNTIPIWEKGIYFTETGSHTSYEIANRIAKAGFELGLLKTDEMKAFSLEEAASKVWGVNMRMAETILISSVRTKAELAHELGWKPQRENEWEGTFRTEILDRNNNPGKLKMPDFVKKE